MIDFSHDVFAEGLCNVECPTVGPGGWILNVCSVSRPEEDWPTRGGDITATRQDAPLGTHVSFTTSTDEVEGIPAAIAFGPDEALYVADEGRRAIVRVGPDASIQDFLTHHENQRLNGPNDLSFDSDGSLYFTDPWTSSPLNPVAAIYGYDWDEGQLHRIDTGMQFTNGIVVRDGRLYVAETFPRLVWVYDIVGRGLANRKQLFCELPPVEDPPRLPPSIQEMLGVEAVVGPDGMAFDADGNLWVTHYGSGGVYAYSPEGSLLDILPCPGAKPTNLCFGGPDLEYLFVAEDELGVILRYELGVRGDRINFCPSTAQDHAWLAMLEGDVGLKASGYRTLPGAEPATRTQNH